MKAGIVRRQLSQVQFYQTAEVLKPMKADIEAGKHTKMTLAAYLSEKMKFEVTANNVSGLFEALEIHPPERSRKADSDQFMELYVELEKRVAVLEVLAKAAGLKNGVVS